MKRPAPASHVQRLLAAVTLGCGVASGAWASSPPAPVEVCSHTVWSILPPPACVGASLGELTGAAGELAELSAHWGQSWEFAGRSDEPGFGLFSGNPQVSFNGVLGFDEPQSGAFVIGLVSSGKHSFYLFNTKRRIGGLAFDSLEGVATTPQGNPFPLDYAAMYLVTSVPEPGTAALWLLGLACAGGASLRVRRRADAGATGPV